MPQIRTIYFINHNHTDIGYTDHQDVVFRQHTAFIDEAIEACEETENFCRDSQFRWTCESAGIIEYYLEQALPSQIDRFLALHRQGRIDVTGMCYNFISPIAPEVLLRSLYPIQRLRDRYGLSIEAAMQCDVNGVSWMFADLLPELGINFLAMAINPTRGGGPSPLPGAFRWEGPSGKHLGVWNGHTYAWGTTFWGMGDADRFVRLMPQRVAELEARTDYPYDFAFVQVTHPVAVDNGPPYQALSRFARDWNAAGNMPKLVFTTLSEFASSILFRSLDDAPVYRGDWVDWWSDGVGTSAYETAVYRRVSELLPVVETLEVWRQVLEGKHAPLDSLVEAYANTLLFAEHSWGSSSSLRDPTGWPTRSQWNRKASYAHIAAALTGEQGSRVTSELAPLLASGGDGLLVVNTLPWARRVEVRASDSVEQPSKYLSFQPQVGRSQRGSDTVDSGAIIDVPGMGFATVLCGSLASPKLGDDGCSLENDWYRIVVDPVTGGLSSWYDKDQKKELVLQDGPWKFAQYVYETVDSPAGRAAIFELDLSRFDHGVAHHDTPWNRRGPNSVHICASYEYKSQACILIEMSVPGCRSASVRFSLSMHRKALDINYVLDKVHVTDPESVYVPFPLAMGTPQFLLDLDGVATVPHSEQIPGSARDWYSVGRWAAISDDDTTVTIVPVDAPLIQVGGITTGTWGTGNKPHDATLVSWVLNNHWHTNFRASQGGEIVSRYLLTSDDRCHDSAASSRFAAETVVPPIVGLGREVSKDTTGSLVTLEPADKGMLWLKPAEDGRGVVCRVQNLACEPVRYLLSFQVGTIEVADFTSPTEDDTEALSVISGESVEFSVRPRSIQSIRFQLASPLDVREGCSAKTI